MTAHEIMARTLSEVTGRPEATCLEDLCRLPFPAPGLDKEYSTEEAERLLASFRKEAPGILIWLVQGARKAHERGSAPRARNINHDR